MEGGGGRVLHVKMGLLCIVKLLYSDMVGGGRGKKDMGAEEGWGWASTYIII